MVPEAAEGFQSSGISNRTQLHTALLYTAAHSCTQLHTDVHKCTQLYTAGLLAGHKHKTTLHSPHVAVYGRLDFPVSVPRGLVEGRLYSDSINQSFTDLVARLARGLDRLPPAGERGASAPVPTHAQLS